MIEGDFHISCIEVQTLLSDYLDQALNTQCHDAIQSHLETCNICLEEYILFKSLDQKVSDLTEIVEKELTATKALPTLSLWSQIEGQLQQDKANAISCEFDEEYISAYLDREFELLTPATELFEAHLLQCEPCNTRLADLSTLSKTYREFGYHLEEGCSISLTASVMAQLQEDSQWTIEALDALQGNCADYSIETLSAFLDQDLPQKEALAVIKHLESCAPCRTYVGDATSISLAYQELCDQWATQVPDFWPALAGKLNNVVSIQAKAKQRRTSKPWIYGSAAAAAVTLLILQFSSVVSPPAPNAHLASVPVHPVAAKEKQAPIVNPMDHHIFHSAVVASNTPVASAQLKQDRGPFAPKMEPSSENNTRSRVNKAQIALVKHPVTLSNTSKVTQAVVAVPNTTAVAYGPSAEEYVMRASRKEIPQEEVSVILGDGSEF